MIYGLREALLFKYVEHFLNSLRRVTECQALPPRCQENLLGRLLQLVPDEVVRMLGLNLVHLQRGLREVFQVERDNHVSPPSDCRRQDVSVVLVRQSEYGYQTLIACHKTAEHVLVHQISCAFQLRAFQVGAVFEHAVDSLLMDVARPFSLE